MRAENTMRGCASREGVLFFLKRTGFLILFGFLKEEILETFSKIHPSKKRPCQFFHQPGGCRNGDNCKFCHICTKGQRKARRAEAVFLQDSLSFSHSLLHSLLHQISKSPVKNLNFSSQKTPFRPRQPLSKQKLPSKNLLKNR